MARGAAKLTAYTWEGVDSKGRAMKGEQEAPSVAFLNASLRRQGIRPKKVRKKSKPLFAMTKKVTPKDITIATRQLATMISAGIPVAQSIDAIARGHDNPKLREVLTKIRQEVESGTNLSTALRQFPRYFDRLYLSLVDAGEQSGTLDRLLEKVADNLEKIEAIKSKIKSALFYPAAVLVVAILVIALLLIFVIPQFEQLFQGFGADLPTLTRAIVDLSRFTQTWWWLMGLILFGGVTLIAWLYRRSPKFQHLVDRISLRLPVFGVIFRKATIARYARTLSTMFGAGVPLVDSLDAVSSATGNRVYYDGIQQIKTDVSTGRTLESSMAATGLFPNMVQQMVGTGEESGELEVMLSKVADFYEREVDDAVAAMSSLIEPLMITILGTVVGIIVVAMYLPVFRMAAVF